MKKTKQNKNERIKEKQSLFILNTIPWFLLYSCLKYKIKRDASFKRDVHQFSNKQKTLILLNVPSPILEIIDCK